MTIFITSREMHGLTKAALLLAHSRGVICKEREINFYADKKVLALNFIAISPIYLPACYIAFSLLDPVGLFAGIIFLAGGFYINFRFYYTPLIEIKGDSILARSGFKKAQYFEDIKLLDLSVFPKYVTIHDDYQNSKNLNGWEYIEQNKKSELVAYLKKMPFRSIKGSI